MSRSLVELEAVLKALANENRLRLLEALRAPKGYRELELGPTRDDAWSRERVISRQGVRHHVKELVKLGVVRAFPVEGEVEARFVVDHARLFGVVEELRRLAAVRPLPEVGGVTMPLDGGGASVPPEGPHLVLVRGVHEGRAFPLPAGASGGSCVIGRQRRADVALDYDPYVSKEHARVVAREGAHFLVGLPESRNGTYLNWGRLAPGAVAPLRPGDVVGVGLSLLVYRV